MKRKTRTNAGILQVCLLACVAVLLVFSLQNHLKVTFFRSNKAAITGPEGIQEEYDSRLSWINSSAKLEKYVDSVIAASHPAGSTVNAEVFPMTLTEVVRKRFYHGVYVYGIRDNFIAYFASKISNRSWNEVWSADEILKSPHAFCGQQCLVEMEVLIKKGYEVRSVRMFSEKYKNGHFAFEVFYNNSWHFFDPDMEPNFTLLSRTGRPSFATLKDDTVMLTNLYPHMESKLLFDLFEHGKTDPVNRLMPQRMYAFQSVTKFLSCFLWLACAGYIVMLFRRYKFWPGRLFRVIVPSNPILDTSNPSF